MTRCYVVAMGYQSVLGPVSSECNRSATLSAGAKTLQTGLRLEKGRNKPPVGRMSDNTRPFKAAVVGSNLRLDIAVIRFGLASSRPILAPPCFASSYGCSL